MRKAPFDAILETGWLLAAVLAPLWINLWANQPFDPAKVALLRSVTWLMGAVWLAQGLLTARNPLRHARCKRLLWPLVTLALVLCAATLLASDPPLSLFGSYERAQGLLTQLSYLLLFLIVATRLQTGEQAQRLLAAMALTAAPLIILGLAQSGGADPLGLVSDARAPVYATLGRANFVGAYVAMLLPLTLALLLLARSRVGRAALGLLLAGQAFLVAASGTRAPLLAAVSGMLTFAFLWRWIRWSPQRRRRGAVVALVVLVAAVAGLLIAVYRARAGSIAARAVIWDAALNLISRRPLLGYGPDSLHLIFPGVYPPQLVYYLGRDFFVDRAHNLFLDWIISAGILGLAALALLWANALRLALRRLSRSSSTNGLLLAAAVAAVAANLANNMVSFDVTATVVATWLLLALVVSPALAPQEERLAQSGLATAQASPVAMPAKRARRLAAGLLLIGVGLAVIQANLRPLLADVDHRRATLRAASGDWDTAVAYARRAVARWPIEPEHHRLLGRAYLGQTLASGDTRTLTAAEAAFISARDIRPLDVAGWSALGSFYVKAAGTPHPAYLDLAHETFARAVALSPHNARLHVAWAQVDVARGRLEEARRHLQRALDLDATDGLAYRLLGDVLLMSGDPSGAQESYQQAQRWLPAP